MKRIYLFVISILFCIPSFACDHSATFDFLNVNSYNNYQEIFIGKVLGVVKPKDQIFHQVTFEIEKNYRNPRSKETRKVILTGGNEFYGATYDFKIGKRYLVFTRDDYHVNLCSRTAAADQSSKSSTTDIIKQGSVLWKKNFEFDRLALEQILKTIQKTGVQTFYDISKKKIGKGAYQNYLATGNWTFYNKNGGVFSQGKYESGKKVGAWKYFTKDGKLSEKIDYNEGKAYRRANYTATEKLDRIYDRGLPIEKIRGKIGLKGIVLGVYSKVFQANKVGNEAKANYYIYAKDSKYYVVIYKMHDDKKLRSLLVNVRKWYPDAWILKLK